MPVAAMIESIVGMSYFRRNSPARMAIVSFTSTKTSTYLEQEVESLMIGRDPVQEAGKGQDVGLAVAARVRKNDRVFRVERI